MVSLDYESREFRDTERLQREFVRQSTICHGCRRCFNYCPAFPTLFRLTDSKGPDKLTLEDTKVVSEQCFHCNMCYINCPYTPPHEFSMDYPRLLEWAFLYWREREGVPLKERLMSMTDALPLVRPLGKLGEKTYETMSSYAGVSPDAPKLRLDPQGFLRTASPKRIESPVAKVVLFHTCLVENFFSGVGNDVIEVYNRLGIEVKVADFRCCGAPYLDSGDAKSLKQNALYNSTLIQKYVEEGYDVVSPIPTCTLMLTKEYPLILGKEAPKVYDVMEYLWKLKREKKIEIRGEAPQKVLYHAPCHLRYLGVGLPGVQMMKSVKADVERVDKGCSGIDGGWGLRHYIVAKSVGSKMMEAFREGKADTFATECPLAGLQIRAATGKEPKHPITVLKEAMSK